MPQYRSFAAVKDAAPAGPGLLYSYREGAFMSVPEVLSAPELASGVAPLISADIHQRDDHFGLIYKGFMKIEKSGLYRLFLACDDGAVLILDGETLIDLDRDGGGSGDLWLNLEDGYHSLELRYWDNFDEENLQLGLKGPGISCENLPAEMLYH